MMEESLCGRYREGSLVFLDSKGRCTMSHLNYNLAHHLMKSSVIVHNVSPCVSYSVQND